MTRSTSETKPVRDRRRCHVAGSIVAMLLLAGFTASPGRAYTAAGDRSFPATIILPQAAPADQFYVTPGTVPTAGNARDTTITETFGKTITDRLGMQAIESYTQLDRRNGPGVGGPDNFLLALKYLAILDEPDEFFATIAVDREFGGTGLRRIGASAQGATMPTAYFGKGLGGIDPTWLRPLSIVGMARYEISDGSPRPDVWMTGFALEYSIPYLQSKVEALDLPEVLRHTTPLVEFLMTGPIGMSYGEHTTAMIAPGFSYAGAGWELGVEALLPLTRASGTGAGVIAQLTFSLDYLLPDSIGRPLFGSP